MEWGPRALGNRSIVCDPRRADMKAHPQCEDQTQGIIPAIRALRPRRCCTRVVRGERRRSVHDAGISNPARKTQAHSSGDPRRRIGTTANRVAATPILSIGN